MPRERQPKAGSMQFWPRKRVKGPIARVRNAPESKETKPLAFIAYKVGMTHIKILKTLKGAKKTVEGAVIPVTILECPPVKIASVRFYKKTTYGLRLKKEVWVGNDKELGRKVKVSAKKPAADFAGIKPEEYSEIRVLLYSQPKLTGIGKKKPELIEISLGGEVGKRLEYVKENLDKDILVKSLFAEGELVDIIGISKGKGFQGTTKRFGTSIRPRKSQKNRRGAANLGPWHPEKVPFTAPQPGKMGYHQRTEYNKRIVKISGELGEIQQEGGFLKYGVIKNPYVLVQGSIIGARKRAVVIRKAIRAKSSALEVPKIQYISNTSKQGK